MIILDEYEKKVCRLAIQTCEHERIVVNPAADNEDVKNSEDLLDELRPQLESLISEYPKSFEALKRKLVDL